MCGIFGYIGKKNAVKMAIEGIKRLEYRGYDSAGIAGIKDGQLLYCKEVGKVSKLENLVKEKNLELDIAIAHTRWATHGEPTITNAHPHFDTDHSISVIHNGIIENYAEIKKSLQKEGVKFVSETDTEVIAHLLAKNYKGNLLEAINQTISLLKGAFAIVVIHKDYPDMMVAIAHESPMVIGIGNEEVFISSDSNAFSPHTREVVFLSSSEIAIVKVDKVEVYNFKNQLVTKNKEQLKFNYDDVSKGNYEHFTLKEIFEQPQTIKNAFSSRFLQEYGTAHFEGLSEHIKAFESTDRILILGCGTSLHAGYIASYMIEESARIPVQVEIASEFRYKNPVLAKNTLVIALSQSGETADTIAAARELKAAKGSFLLSICNVQGSTLARESDYTIFLHAGPEIGVCSTKAFTSQLVVLSLLALFFGRMRHMSRENGQHFINHLTMIPEQVQTILNQAPYIASLANKYAHYNNFFFLGRQYMYPTSLEGALKLKEISYINAVAYPAGEMKHGPIALINTECPTIALCGNKHTFDKMLSNLMEVKARKGPILAIIEPSQREAIQFADDVIEIPSSLDILSPILTSIALQLFAYYVALKRKTEIDQPRNLAKSVTVE